MEFLCAFLGLDRIFLYTPDMTLSGSISVPEGHGVRHLVFSDDGRYCFSSNELCSSVSSFRYENGNMDYIETVSALPADCKKESAASAIRYEAEKIYVSNRGHDSISVLTHAEGKMSLSEIIDCGGSFPRDFDIVGDFIISANEKSNSVTVIDKRTMREADKITGIDAPVCIIYMSRTKKQH